MEGKEHLLHHRHRHLNPLHFGKRFHEFSLWIFQAVYSVTEQELGRRIERQTIEKIHYVKLLARFREKIHHGLCTTLKDFQVGNAILDKHGPKQLPAVAPQLAVGGKNAIAQKGAPEIMEAFTLAIVGKVPGQNGLDMGRLPSQDDAGASGKVALDAIGTCWGAKTVYDVVHMVKEAVFQMCPAGFQDKVDVCS